jgi:hypothetical protein
MKFQGVGGEYPASSTSASEAANEKMTESRGSGAGSSLDFIPFLADVSIVFIMVTNFVLSVSFSVLRKSSHHRISVWRPFSCVSFLNCLVCGGGRAPSNYLEGLLWNRDVAAHDSILLSYLDALYAAVSQRGH